SMPFFSMVRRPRVDTRRETQRRSVSSQKRWVWRLGRKRRRFLLLAWETRFPTATLLPVTSQTRLIKIPTNQSVKYWSAGFWPPKGSSLYQPSPNGATLVAENQHALSARRPALNWPEWPRYQKAFHYPSSGRSCRAGRR